MNGHSIRQVSMIHMSSAEIGRACAKLQMDDSLAHVPRTNQRRVAKAAAVRSLLREPD